MIEKEHFRKMKTRGTVFTVIRNISRNAVIRRLLPYNLQSFLWGFVLRSKGEKLRKEVIKHYGRTPIRSEKVQAAVDFLKKTKNGFYSFDFLRIWMSGDEKKGTFNLDNIPHTENVENPSKNGYMHALKSVAKKRWIKIDRNRRIADGGEPGKNGYGRGKTGRYFDFNGAKLPDISRDAAQMSSLLQIFQDTFLFFCLLEDDYRKKTVDIFDPCMMEGPYGLSDAGFDVTVKPNDVVVDVGAWIGDFSAYAAAKGATAYAFEPLSKNYELLSETAALNEPRIIPIKKGLGNVVENKEIYVNENDTAGSGMYLTKSKKKEIIEITTLDEFVEKENVKKLDFIKADIEGGERYLLMGAKRVLKEFAPKLAICTYHFPEDPELLERLILDANQNYKIVHTKQKLFAAVKVDGG